VPAVEGILWVIIYSYGGEVQLGEFSVFMHGLWFGLSLLLAGIATADELSARSCTSIEDKMARLACYDAALGVNTAPVPRSATSEAAPNGSQTAPAASPPAVSKTPGDAFGDTGNLIGTQKPVLPKRLIATVLNAVPVGQGLYRLTLDNGQIWQTTQADWAVDFDSHNSVTISRMMFGNYLISRTGQGRTVSVKRLQ
jgi:hypothetical protein